MGFKKIVAQVSICAAYAIQSGVDKINLSKDIYLDIFVPTAGYNDGIGVGRREANT